MGLIMMVLLLLSRIILMFGRMAVWFFDHLTGVSSSGAGFFCSSSWAFLERLYVVMLMMFVLILIRRIVEVSLQFLDHFNLFKELSNGVLFWL